MVMMKDSNLMREILLSIMINFVISAGNLVNFIIIFLLRTLYFDCHHVSWYETLIAGALSDINCLLSVNTF